MPPAWQVRAAQQQEFVERYMNAVYDLAAEEENEDAFLLNFTQVILHRIAVGHTLGTRPEPGVDLAGRIMHDVLRGINTFARVQPEVSHLLILLFEKIKVSAFAQFHAAWSREESMNAPQALHAQHSTDEIDFPSTGCSAVI